MEYTTLTDTDTAVLEAATAAARRLYLPGVQEVGAALRTTGGQIFAGIHIESATGFATICGEVAALCTMVAAGHRDLGTIAAVWRSPDGALHLLPPCGRCRELIAEFNPRAWVILSRMEDHWNPDAIQHPAKVPIGALLPRK